MGEDVEIVMVYNHLPELTAAVERTVSKLVRKAAFDIAAAAIPGDPRDTGFLKSSIYVVVHDGENRYPYGNADSPPEGAYLLPEVDTPTSPTEAIVAVGANYGIYQELGTVNMPAQPYLTPAAEFVKPQFLAAMEQLEIYLTVEANLGAEG